jgi:hypothetical protein
MRPIKFKARRTFDNKWIEGDLIRNAKELDAIQRQYNRQKSKVKE